MSAFRNQDRALQAIGRAGAQAIDRLERVRLGTHEASRTAGRYMTRAAIGFAIVMLIGLTLAAFS